MNSICEILLVAYTLINFVALLVYMIVILSESYKTIEYISIFLYQNLWKLLREYMNKAGSIIILIVLHILTLPALVVFHIIIYVILIPCKCLVKVFIYLFRNKETSNMEKDLEN